MKSSFKNSILFKRCLLSVTLWPSIFVSWNDSIKPTVSEQFRSSFRAVSGRLIVFLWQQSQCMSLDLLVKISQWWNYATTRSVGDDWRYMATERQKNRKQKTERKRENNVQNARKGHYLHISTTFRDFESTGNRIKAGYVQLTHNN